MCDLKMRPDYDLSLVAINQETHSLALKVTLKDLVSLAAEKRYNKTVDSQCLGLWLCHGLSPSCVKMQF